MSQDTNVENLIINKLTRAQYESITTPDPTQLYFITDEVISSADVIAALGYTPYNATNPAGYISSAAISSLTDVALTGLADGQILKYNSTTQKWENAEAAAAAVWGSITGTLSNQTDLQNALDAKQDQLTAGSNITIEDTPSGWANAVQDSNLGSHEWYTLAYDGTKFVATGYNYLSTSTDGITWAPATQVNFKYGRYGATPQAMTYGDGKFVAIGYNGSDGYYYTSTNGTTWGEATVESNLGVFEFWVGIAYDGTKFVAINNYGYISTSTNGTNWSQATQVAALEDNTWYSLAYDGTKFIALGQYGYIATSTDGTSWSQATQVSSLHVDDGGSLAFDGTKLIATGYESSVGYYSVSTDGGATWSTTQDDNLGDHDWRYMTYGDGKFVAIGYNGYKSYLYSETGKIISATDTTYNAFTGATGSAAGTSGLVPAPTATDNTKYLKGDGTWATVDSLPSQTGNNGKFLTTNGTTASWAAITDPAWGNITGTLSNQTDLQNALDAKQATLVSGTNIKTINSTSLLGNGDISVQPTLVSGTNIKTINSTSLLGSGDVSVQPTITSSAMLSSDLVDDTNETHKFATSAQLTQIATNTTDISTINGKIPAQATSSNQLADKAFVNSSIQTATANFRGNWDNWAAVPTSASSYPADYAGSTTPTVNDYLVVQDASDYTGDTLEGTWRFKYSGTWATDGKNGWLPEYQVNETPLTTAQLAALNSGITSSEVALIGTALQPGDLKTVNNVSLIGSGNIDIDSLPSQTGQSGKFLTTDGTDASWATVTIPTPTYDSTNERITW